MGRGDRRGTRGCGQKGKEGGGTSLVRHFGKASRGERTRARACSSREQRLDAAPPGLGLAQAASTPHSLPGAAPSCPVPVGGPHLAPACPSRPGLSQSPRPVPVAPACPSRPGLCQSLQPVPGTSPRDRPLPPLAPSRPEPALSPTRRRTLPPGRCRWRAGWTDPHGRTKRTPWLSLWGGRGG
jgi:hypothetical protein